LISFLKNIRKQINEIFKIFDKIAEIKSMNIRNLLYYILISLLTPALYAQDTEYEKIVSDFVKDIAKFKGLHIKAVTTYSGIFKNSDTTNIETALIKSLFTEYDRQGRIVRIVTYDTSGSLRSTDSTEIRVSYDNMICPVYIHEIKKNGVYTDTYISYDSLNRVIKIDKVSDKSYNNSLIWYEYDDVKNCIIQFSKIFESETIYKRVFCYDGNKNIISEEFCAITPDTTRYGFTEIFEYDYDDNGIIKQKLRIIKGKQHDIDTVAYIYNSAGKEIEETLRHSIPTEKSVIEYNDRNEPVKKTSYWGKEKLKVIENEYDNEGKITRSKIKIGIELKEIYIEKFEYYFFED